MPISTGRMTELEAINRMLRSVGDFQAESLIAPEREDVQRAVDELADATRDVLSQGWWFNTEEEYPLPPDADGRIPVPENFSRVDLCAPNPEAELVQRDSFLYNKKTRTNLGFTEPVKVDAIVRLPFASLPHEAQVVILITAGRAFQEAELGEVVQSRFSLQALNDAWVALNDAELENEDFNMLDSPDLQELRIR